MFRADKARVCPVSASRAAPVMVIDAPCCTRRCDKVVMSARNGRFSRVSVSSVSSAAVISGKAAFLAPPMDILPSSGLPPRIRIRSIHHPPGPACVRPRSLVAEGTRLLKPSRHPYPAALEQRRGAPPVPGPVPCAASDWRAAPPPAAPAWRRPRGRFRRWYGGGRKFHPYRLHHFPIKSLVNPAFGAGWYFSKE